MCVYVLVCVVGGCESVQYFGLAIPMLLSTMLALSCIINYRRHLFVFRSRRLIGDAVMSRGITMQQQFDFEIDHLKKELVKLRKQMDEAKKKEKSAELGKLQKKERDVLNERQRLQQGRNFDKVVARLNLYA